ncbi:MAG: DUF3604 domain-containing protein [Gammaproteobacteria bacterium]|nr:DUF3604 domain-containing protein [Gammaproteobacteria bacterium]
MTALCLPGPVALGAGRGESVAATAVTVADSSKHPTYPPGRDGPEPTNLYWGDTHLHTSYSPDAFATGTQTLTPDAAYRFARGEEVVSESGLRARLRRPLDFLAVTDHAEYLGVLARLARGDATLETWPTGRRWAGLMRAGDWAALFDDVLSTARRKAPEDRVPEAAQQTIFAEVARAADSYDEPGRFTAIIGYEWSATVAGDNLHRNVLFRGDAASVADHIPFSSQESTDPEQLWAALARYEAQSGGRVLAIPHNGNLSNGRMFAPARADGQPFTHDYARTRARWEPVAEVTQIKGDGETHPTLSPDDEFADFERWDQSNLLRSSPKQPGMLQYEYARSALGLGLGHEARLGINPFKFGMIGGTDSHNALSSTEEDYFFGKFKDSEPSPSRYQEPMAQIGPENWRLVASGLTAVWATQNTRAAVFDAIARREVYATTGSRIQVRFFGGWRFEPADVLRPDFGEIGYVKGVPMGGDLAPGGNRGSPRFMVLAGKDPQGANLDRIQIIKGWLGADGNIQERVYDVALSDGRAVDPETGKAPPVGSTVNVADATYTNSIGDALLTTVWTDPDFNRRLRAYYYVRVIEIPKPRWTAYDAQYFALTLPEEVPVTVQDRAYTSPIWYNP